MPFHHGLFGLEKKTFDDDFERDFSIEENPNNRFIRKMSNVTQPIEQQSKGTSAMGQFSDLIDPFAEMYDSQTKTQDDWAKSFKEMNSWAMPVEDDGSYPEMAMKSQFDPFQDFKWGMNMPTFQVAKGAFDTAGTLFDAYNKFRNFGLREDMFEEGKRVADRDYLAAKGLQNIKFDKMDFNRAERNAFKKAYGGPEGDYLMEDPVNRRALG